MFPAGDFGNTAAIASRPPIAADRIAEIVYAIPPHQLCFVGQPDPSCSRRAGSKRRASGGSYSRDRAPSPSCEQRLGSRCGVRDGSPTASGRPSMCPLDAERAADSRQKITLYIETLRPRASAMPNNSRYTAWRICQNCTRDEILGSPGAKPDQRASARLFRY